MDSVFPLLKDNGSFFLPCRHYRAWIYPSSTRTSVSSQHLASAPSSCSRPLWILASAGSTCTSEWIWSAAPQNSTRQRSQNQIFVAHTACTSTFILWHSWIITCCTASNLNSTLQPILSPGGGGLNLMVCQFVDWMFSKWSTSSSS